MKKVFVNAEWIWIHGENKPDEYAEFIFDFERNCNEAYRFFITADSNYNVYLNDELVGFGQPTDYPNYKIYDEFLLEKVVNGKNRIKVIVWYYGMDTQTYIKDDVGAIFELRNDKETMKFILIGVAIVLFVEKVSESG